MHRVLMVAVPVSGAQCEIARVARIFFSVFGSPSFTKITTRTSPPDPSCQRRRSSTNVGPELAQPDSKTTEGKSLCDLSGPRGTKERSGSFTLPA